MIAGITAKAAAWLFAGLGAAAYAAYEVLGKKPPPLQSIRRISPSGVPVQIVVPAVSVKPANAQASTPIPSSNPPASTATYTPQTLDNVVPPRIITPAGSANLAPVLTNRDVQSALNTLGFGPLAVDGNIGPMSTAAVKRFQQVHGLTVDGVPGPITKNALTAALAELAATNAVAAAGPAVQQAVAANVQGAAALQSVLDNLQSASPAPVDLSTIAGLQHALNQLGASPTLTEDGVRGPMTIAATKAFQISHGLASDGIAGPMTKAAILTALNG